MYEYINICEDMIESNIILEKVEEKNWKIIIKEEFKC